MKIWPLITSIYMNKKNKIVNQQICFIKTFHAKYMTQNKIIKLIKWKIYHLFYLLLIKVKTIRISFKPYLLCFNIIILIKFVK